MNILITGVSRGIGLHLTRLALESGDVVFAVARNPSGSPELKTLMGQYGAKLIIIPADLTSPEAFDKIAQGVGENPLDILINNAGVLRSKDSYQDFMDTFQINSIVPFFLAKSLLPQLKKSKDPKVIHITSRMGSISDNGSGGHYSYRASKAALNMINKSFSIDNPWLTAMVVHPGWVQTDMGGTNAPVAPQDSAAGIWKVIHNARKEHTGRFMDYQGEVIPW